MSIAFDGAGSAHISHYSWQLTDLKYARETENGWEIQTVDSPGYVGSDTSIAVDANGYAHIGYYDAARHDLRYARRNGSAWTIQTVDSVGDVGTYVSMALDSAGWPHMSYYDETNRDLKHAWWNGSAWVLETVDSTDDVGRFTSIVIGSNDNPSISFYNATNKDLKYAKWNGLTWNIDTVDSDGDVGSHTSMVLDSSGYPNISYLNTSGFDIAPKYAKWNGTAWEIQTIESGLNCYYSCGTSIALDSNGYAHISYFAGDTLKLAKWIGSGWNIQTVALSPRFYGSDSAIDSMNLDHVSYGLEGAASSILLLASWDGSSWNTQAVDTSFEPGWYSSIALDSAGHPQISYFDDYTYELKYAIWTGSYWALRNIDQVWMGLEGGTSLAIDSNDRGRIGYYDGGNGDLKYAAWNGGSWSIEVVDSTGNVGKYPSMALDDDDHPHFSYYDVTNSDLKYAEWNGTGWARQAVDSAGNVGAFTSLALDGNGFPHIAYYNVTNHDLKYAEWNGSRWKIETVDSLLDVGKYTSIAIDASGYAHISYEDATSQDLKYARWTGSIWDIQVIDSVAQVSGFTSLDFSSDGRPCISYHDEAGSYLKFAKWTGSTWSVEVVDSAIGSSISLAIDSSGYAHMSYRWGALKYARGIGNEPPETPSKPSGPGSGNTGVSYTYSTAASDPDADSLRYTFNWGDFTTSQTGYLPSGATGSSSHSWSAAGTYLVRTMARDIHGSASGWSQPLTVVIAGLPASPGTLSASPGNREITLTWAAPLNDGGSAITNYRVYRGPTSGGEVLLVEIGNVSTFKDTGLNNGQKYFYKVSAKNVVGEGPKSNEASATPATTPSEPQLQCSAGNRQVNLTWSVPASDGGSAITGYKIYRGIVSGGEVLLTAIGNVLTYTDGSLTNGQTYFYQVSALNIAGEGPRSEEVNATPASIPGKPVGLTAAGADEQIHLTWSAPSDDGGSRITNYTVYRGTAAGGEQFLATVGLRLSYIDAGLTNGQTYYYQVSAQNAVGEGPKSSEVSAIPNAAVPSPPVNLTVISNIGGISIAWFPPLDDGGSPVMNYTVYRGVNGIPPWPYAWPGNVLAFTDFYVRYPDNFSYLVTANNSMGESPSSNKVSAIPILRPSPSNIFNVTAGDGAITLKWTEPSERNGALISAYTIYRGTTPSGETSIATCPYTGSIETYADSGLVNGHTYYYYVTAWNLAGEGPRSNEVNATPMGLPGPPISLIVVDNIGNITLAWLPPLDDGGSPITNYTVYRGANFAGVSFYVELGNVLNYTDTNVTTNIVYNYVVSASNLMGEGLWSNQVDVRPIFPPSPSWIFDVVSGNKTVTLEWWPPFEDNGAPVTHYSVYRGTAPGGEVFLTTAPATLVVETYTDTGLTNGQTYYYYVTAWNLAGEGANSSEVSATPASVPSAPTVLTATAGNAEVTLTWSPPADNGGLPITNYVIYRGTVSGGELFLIEVANVLTLTDVGLTNGVTYYYKVAALNAVGQSPNSTEVSATPATIPGAPQNLSAVTGDGHITMTWSAPADDGGLPISGYTVWRGTASGGEAYLETLTNVLTYVDTGLTNGQTHYYTVNARNAVGEGPNSTEVNATPATTPSEPLIAWIGSGWDSSTGGEGTIELIWLAPATDGGSPITHYRVYRGTEPGVLALLAEIGDVLEYNDTSVVPSQVYYYRVSAVNAVGEGPKSSEENAALEPRNPPPGPTRSIFEEPWFWAVVAVVIIILVSLFVFILRRKKGKQEKEESPEKEEQIAKKENPED